MIEMNPSQQLGRTETQAAFTPSEEWRCAFEKQATRRMLDKVNRIAKARLAVFKGGFENVTDVDVDEVVIGTLGDTWMGVLTWDHEHKPLFSHLKDAVAYRVRNEAHLHRCQLADSFAEDENNTALGEQVAAGGVTPTIESPEARDAHLARMVDAAIAALRPLAANDRDVSSLLDVLARRVVDRADIIEETGMTLTEHNNAWRRLGRLVQKLPAQERSRALAALT